MQEDAEVLGEKPHQHKGVHADPTQEGSRSDLNAEPDNSDADLQTCPTMLPNLQYYMYIKMCGANNEHLNTFKERKKGLRNSSSKPFLFGVAIFGSLWPLPSVLLAHILSHCYQI